MMEFINTNTNRLEIKKSVRLCCILSFYDIDIEKGLKIMYKIDMLFIYLENERC